MSKLSGRKESIKGNFLKSTTTFTKKALKEIKQIHKLSSDYNVRLGKNHSKRLLRLIMEHTKEIEKRYKSGDKHYLTETGDLLVLCLELILEGRADPDKIMQNCYRRYNKKLPALITKSLSMPPENKIIKHKNTYVWKEKWDNLIWKDKEDKILLNEEILLRKRENRLTHENSEDALTWNVFRGFQKQEQLHRIVDLLIGQRPKREPEIIYWTVGLVGLEGKCWSPYIEASKYYGEKEKSRSETDIILFSEREYLIFIEAKFGSLTRKKYYRSEEELQERIKRYSRGNRFLNVPVGEMINQGFYELMRNWLIGCYIQEREKFSNFFLINLVLERNKKDNIESEFSPLIKSSPNRKFSVKSWEEIYRIIPPIPKLGILKQYFEKKTLNLQPAFTL